jgi:glutamyl-tRNA synthetase
MAELIEMFDFDAVSKSGGVWNAKKLEWLNAHWIKAEPPAEIARLLVPLLAAHGVTAPDLARLEAAVVLQRERAKNLVELAAASAFYFQDPPPMDAAAAAKFLTDEALGRVEALAARFEALPAWDAPSLEAATTAYLAESGLELKAVAQAVRVALAGRAQSPGLYEVMVVLGRERSLARLRGARQAARVGA